MIEVLALLLPVAAASGWYAAKRAFHSEYLARRAADRHASCARGLGLLLQDKLDEAMAALSPMIESDTEGLELRLAIGIFFRRRGEFDKALAVHEAAADQTGLTPEQRAGVSFELGLDYLGAGLLDRAESAFSTLLEVERFRAEALRQLIKIYQRQKDWPRSLQCARDLRLLNRSTKRESVAQFYCELAEQELIRDDRQKAVELLRLALQDDAACVRASIGLGRVLMQRGHWAEAASVLQNVEHQDPDFLPEVLAALTLCYTRGGRERAFPDYLRRLYQRFHCVEAACLLGDYLLKFEGSKPASDFLQSALAANPSLSLSQKLLEVSVPGLAPDERGVFRDVAGVLADRARIGSGYRCIQCGFSGAELHWRCPSCQTWATVKPSRDFGHSSEKIRM